MPVFTIPIHEHNDCHAEDSGRFCSKGIAKTTGFHKRQSLAGFLNMYRADVRSGTRTKQQVIRIWRASRGMQARGVRKFRKAPLYSAQHGANRVWSSVAAARQAKAEAWAARKRAS
jgi:hypothetical protein